MKTISLVGPLALAVLASCSFTSKLHIRNDTTHDWVPFPVVTTPPPPHREPDPGQTVPVGAEGEIDPKGFNPVYYTAGIASESRPNGIFIGLALYDDDPRLIQYKVYHYRVPPGAEGTDPGMQPILLEEGTQEVPDRDILIDVAEFQSDVTGVTWKVEISTQP